eukprot:scaffold5143_cov119-Isochrysis_galbana.AAC.3
MTAAIGSASSPAAIMAVVPLPSSHPPATITAAAAVPSLPAVAAVMARAVMATAAVPAPAWSIAQVVPTAWPSISRTMTPLIAAAISRAFTVVFLPTRITAASSLIPSGITAPTAPPPILPTAPRSFFPTILLRRLAVPIPSQTASPTTPLRRVKAPASISIPTPSQTASPSPLFRRVAAPAPISTPTLTQIATTTPPTRRAWGAGGENWHRRIQTRRAWGAWGEGWHSRIGPRRVRGAWGEGWHSRIGPRRVRGAWGEGWHWAGGGGRLHRLRGRYRCGEGTRRRCACWGDWREARPRRHGIVQRVAGGTGWLVTHGVAWMVARGGGEQSRALAESSFAYMARTWAQTVKSTPGARAAEPGAGAERRKATPAPSLRPAFPPAHPHPPWWPRSPPRQRSFQVAGRLHALPRPPPTARLRSWLHWTRTPTLSSRIASPMRGGAGVEKNN